jgi:hypothetical protein
LILAKSGLLEHPRVSFFIKKASLVIYFLHFQDPKLIRMQFLKEKLKENLVLSVIGAIKAGPFVPNFSIPIRGICVSWFGFLYVDACLNLFISNTHTS